MPRRTYQDLLALAATMPIDGAPDPAKPVSRAGAGDGAVEGFEIMQELGRSDEMNAQRLYQIHGERLRWVGSWQKWLVWDGRRWFADRRHVFEDFARGVGKAYRSEILALPPDTVPREAFAWQRYTFGWLGRDRMLKCARSIPEISIDAEQLDADPWLLNCENGTLDLRTGELLPHDKEKYHTKLCPTVFDPGKECPLWLAFLTRVTGGDVELEAYLQKLAGYSLTGAVHDHLLAFLYGTGANGKSTFLNTLLAVLGRDYAMQAPPDMLMAKDRGSHPTEQADLAGRRLVVCIEAEEGKRLAESLVKTLTGGDRVRARRMREDFWEFSATHKLWLAANHKPSVRGTDWGIWRRIKLVPFTVQIPIEEQDRELPDKLKLEASGILNWALAGTRLWLAEGLAEPKCVSEATAGYRSEMDVLGAFIDECCTVNSGLASRAKDLYGAYSKWCDESGENSMSQRRFGVTLQERGFVKYRYDGICYKGIALRNACELQL